MTATLFDVVVTHPDIADSTNFLLLSQALQPHQRTRAAAVMMLHSAEVLEDLGHTLGWMLQQEFGAAAGHDILRLLVETASQALHDTPTTSSESDR